MRVARRVRFESAAEIAPHQFSVLARLDTAPTSVGDLAAQEQISAPSMSRTVTGLDKLGCVERSADPSDGRVVLVALTERGSQVLAVERAHRDAWMSARLEDMSLQEQEILRQATELLERVVAR